MAAFLTVVVEVTDDRRWRAYREAVLPLIAGFGGTHVTGPEQVQQLESAGNRRLAVFRFPSLDAVHSFWNSPAYGPVKALRADAAVLDAWAVAVD